jgi:hypothetical protein
MYYFTDRSGIINFMEFVCALWNILTMDESNMGSLAFMIADPTASKLLSCTTPLCSSPLTIPEVTSMLLL